jgi:hypothetical protein
MILKFDKSISIIDARNQYNDTVKFITDTKSYPDISGIEFNGDPQKIFKRKAIRPKITKKLNKLIKEYSEFITAKWNETFDNVIKDVTTVSKDDEYNVTRARRSKALKRIEDYKQDVRNEAKKNFETAYQLGKIRGQVISNQEVDDSISEDDEKNIEEKLDENEEYLFNFSDDIQTDLDRLLEQPFETEDDLAEAIKTKVQEPKKSRALLYALALTGLVVTGMVYALKQANPNLGETKLEGGYWTVHPEEGKGGPICDGCEKLNGKWMTLDKFNEVYGSHQCLSNCRCDLDLV